MQYSAWVNVSNISKKSSSTFCLPVWHRLPQKVPTIQKLKSQTKAAPVAGMNSITSSEPSEKLLSRDLHISFPYQIYASVRLFRKASAIELNLGFLEPFRQIRLLCQQMHFSRTDDKRGKLELINQLTSIITLENAFKKPWVENTVQNPNHKQIWSTRK